MGWHAQETPRDGDHFYLHHYLRGVNPVSPQAPIPSKASLRALLEQSSASDQQKGLVGRRERLLVRLVHLRRSRTGRAISRMIPIWLQKVVRKLLSRRPIHELL
jgi:hypothetical protein